MLNTPIGLQLPATVRFGDGCRKALPELVEAAGAKAIFVLVSRSAASAVEPLLAALRLQGCVVRVDSSTPPEPTVADFQRLCALARAEPLDCVIGIGGGSVLDVAKLIAALHDVGSPVESFFGQGLVQGRRARLICLPTTAGAGSEASPNAILLDSVARAKRAVISPHLVPDATLVDPELTHSVPPAVTAATGIDALVHCLEVYTNRHAHALVDPFALAGVRLIASALPRAFRDGRDREARAAVALGSFYGGLGLGPVNTAAVHALAYPLGSEYGLPHGLANALLLCPVWEFNASAAPRRHAEVARALGVAPGLSDEESIAQGTVALRALCAEVGIPSSLRAVGLSEEALPGLARSALLVTRLLKNNPRELTYEDALRLYRSVF